MTTRDDLVTPATTRALLALLRVHARDGRATVRSVACEANRSVSKTHQHLARLHELGLVDYPNGKQAALHPLVRVVR